MKNILLKHKNHNIAAVAHFICISYSLSVTSVTLAPAGVSYSLSVTSVTLAPAGEEDKSTVLKITHPYAN